MKRSGILPKAKSPLGRGRWIAIRHWIPTSFRKLFELGLMGIEIPDEMGGAGSTFFTSILVVEELSRVDPAVGTLVDVQNTLCHQRPPPLGL